MEQVKGYKFNGDWTCRGKQYTCPGKFEEDVNPSVCNVGMHFCKKAADCFNYYHFNPENKVAEVIAYGTVMEDGDKCCTDKIEIVREIPWAELLEIVNTGKGCTGLNNTGDCNTGNRNTGNWNTGDQNTGNRNTGDWNKTDHSNGCFNTIEPQIYLFNKPSNCTYKGWLNSNARYIMSRMPQSHIEWVRSANMTDEEKASHPEHEVAGGFLRQKPAADRQIWWNNLSEGDKAEVKGIPNFDAAIFKEITGIEVAE